jgi:hypothetical protein
MHTNIHTLLLWNSTASWRQRVVMVALSFLRLVRKTGAMAESCSPVLWHVTTQMVQQPNLAFAVQLHRTKKRPCSWRDVCTLAL